MREDLVQAGGGNSSVKISPTEMLIKASGCQLAEITKNFGFCRVNPKVVTDFFEEAGGDSLSAETEKQLIASCLFENNGSRPSDRNISSFHNAKIHAAHTPNRCKYPCSDGKRLDNAKRLVSKRVL